MSSLSNLLYVMSGAKYLVVYYNNICEFNTVISLKKKPVLHSKQMQIEVFWRVVSSSVDLWVLVGLQVVTSGRLTGRVKVQPARRQWVHHPSLISPVQKPLYCTLLIPISTLWALMPCCAPLTCTIRGTPNPAPAACLEPAYSLYSTDSEDQVRTSAICHQ